MEKRRIDVSHKTIFFITFFVLTLWLLYQIRDVILLLFIATIFMSALAPLVDQLTKYRIPKALSIILIYLGLFSIVGGLISLIVAPLVSQTSHLIGNLPEYTQRLIPSLGLDVSLLQDQIATISSNVGNFALALFSNIVTFISLAVLSFYLLMDRERVHRLIVQLVPGDDNKTQNLIEKIEGKLGAWLRGQLILSLVVGALSYAVLYLFNIPYALPLAILAGFMEIIPVIGPIISAIPAILVAFVISPTIALLVGIAFFGIQQLENSFLVPQVMNKAVGLNPLIVIIAIAIGGRLLGIPGALLAVPITVVIQVLIEELLNVNLNDYSEASGTKEN